MATPDQVKKIIENEYIKLCARAHRGETNESCISGIIESLAINGARHNGCARYWREYIPNELMNNTEDRI